MPDTEKRHPGTFVSLSRRHFLAKTGLATAALVGRKAHAAATKVRVATQLGLAYLPLIVMEHDRLWEQHAERRGLTVATEYIRLGGGEALNDALISNSVDLVAGGLAPMLLLWDRTWQPRGCVVTLPSMLLQCTF